MNEDVQLTRSAAAGAAALACVWLAMLLLGTGPLDQRVLAFVYAGKDPALVGIARVFTFLGEPTLLVGVGLVAAAWLWWRHWPGYALSVVVVTLSGRGLAEVQKYAIDRPRPIEVLGLVHTHTPSFPSGHATSSMIVFLTLALVLVSRRGWRRVFVPLALLLSACIGLSRVMLGVHWPSDVIAGWSFGALWVVLVLPLAERFAKRYSPHPKRERA